MHETLESLQQQFGERFGGMELTAAETIYWPVYRHKLTLSDVNTMPLNVVEEGLLRLVSAGVNDLEEICDFLGAGNSYVRMLAKRLVQTGKGKVEAPVRLDEVTLRVTAGPGLDEALRLCRRSVVDLEETWLLRDSIFGTWLDCEGSPFNVIRPPNPRGEEMRWLGSILDSTTDLDVDVISAFMTARHRESECEAVFSEQGALAWVELKLGIYQAHDGRFGRLLVFNERNDQEPLEEISQQLEKSLVEGRDILLYFQDDQRGSARAFWKALTSGVRTVNAEKQLHVALDELAVAKDEYQCKSRSRRSRSRTADEFATDYTQGILEALAWIEEKAFFEAAAAYRHAVSALINLLNLRTLSPAREKLLDHLVVEYSVKGMSEIAKRLQTHDKDSREVEEDFAHTSKQFAQDLPTLLRDMAWDLRELGRSLDVRERIREVDRKMFEDLRNAKTRIEKLESVVRQAPIVRPLETKDHPSLLIRAIEEATHTIVIFSPWINMSVLREYLSGLENALRRGCEIWIGYGMPQNSRHEDKTDPDALKALQRMYSIGKMYLVNLAQHGGTHAKEVICDDRFYVATSFNWLSYSGRDKRRETGLLVESPPFVQERLNQSVNSLRGILDLADNPVIPPSQHSSRQGNGRRPVLQ